MMTQSEQYFYEEDLIWNNEPLPYQLNVLEDIKLLLPENINSILDVGCGDGFITNNLPHNLRVVGIDWSKEALKYVIREKQQALATEIPFEDNSFDLVMANDIIEHFNKDDCAQALNEISRIAKKNIIISVPFEEILDNQLTTCFACGNIYHINLHKRSYNLNMLVNLYNKNWKPKKIVFSGYENSKEHFYIELIRKELSLKRKNDYSSCPKCHISSSFDFNESNLVINPPQNDLTLNYLKKICPRNEVIVLYEYCEQLSEQTSPLCNEIKDENFVNGIFQYLYGDIEFIINRCSKDVFFSHTIFWFIRQLHNILNKDFFSYNVSDNFLNYQSIANIHGNEITLLKSSIDSINNNLNNLKTAK
jgi:ubiquinone/menaquinone biosynthesis C-methylase UbiE